MFITTQMLRVISVVILVIKLQCLTALPTTPMSPESTTTPEPTTTPKPMTTPEPTTNSKTTTTAATKTTPFQTIIISEPNKISKATIITLTTTTATTATINSTTNNLGTDNNLQSKQDNQNETKENSLRRRFTASIILNAIFASVIVMLIIIWIHPLYKSSSTINDDNTKIDGIILDNAGYSFLKDPNELLID